MCLVLTIKKLKLTGKCLQTKRGTSSKPIFPVFIDYLKESTRSLLFPNSIETQAMGKIARLARFTDDER